METEIKEKLDMGTKNEDVMEKTSTSLGSSTKLEGTQETDGTEESPSNATEKGEEDQTSTNSDTSTKQEEAKETNDAEKSPSNAAEKGQDDKTSTNSDTSTKQEEAKETHDAEKPLSNAAEKEQEDKTEEVDSKNKEISDKDFSEHYDYETKDGKYYYTDSQSGVRYMYDENSGQWVVSDDQEVRKDEEGRTYYKAEGMDLCQDAQGNVFFLSENNEWVPWGSGRDQKENSKWYFHQGDNMFYRDKISNVVYRYNKDNNEWEVYEGKLRVKRPRIDPDEEFDTDEEEEYDDEEDDYKGTAPPGARNDPSIDYDGVTYTKRDPGDNMIYEWDTARRAWFPKLDEDFMATYQLSYGFNPDGTKNENPLKFDDELDEPDDKAAEEAEAAKKAKANQAKSKPTWFEMDETANTKVYVSNLPNSTTEEEFLVIMQKCGMILKDLETNEYKIKMYKDSEGNFKGDALCTYIKRESVELALQILDDYQIGNQKIHVEQAKFQLKGEYNAKLKPRKKKKKDLEKLQKRQQKLFDWRPEPMRGQRQKHERTVIIRNVFDPKEFEKSVEKILTHKEAMRNQCLNFGEITKFELHDLHPDGVVQVTFAEVEAADMCVATLNNRLYTGRNISVSTWDGKQKFRIEETDAQREERLKKWDKFIETGGQKEQ